MNDRKTNSYQGKEVDRRSFLKKAAMASAVFYVSPSFGGLSATEKGLRGNTHFPMSDLNNAEIAELMSGWLHERDLD